MPEALEKWPVKVLGKLLPRHLEIIDKIDTIWKDSLKARAAWGVPWFSAGAFATCTSRPVSSICQIQCFSNRMGSGAATRLLDGHSLSN